VLNRALTHSGDPDLARHVGHAVVKNDSRGHRIVKQHNASTRKIDLAVAAVMAFAASRRWSKHRNCGCSTSDGYTYPIPPS
jgi:phage terminase large subunit-like protein